MEVNTETESDSEDDDVNHAQIGDEIDHSGEFFEAHMHDHAGEDAYKRVAPARFSADSDDIFMRSMVNSYSLEGKNKDGSPNGNFMVNESGAKAAAMEVMGTHKGMTGADLASYMTTYFPRTWAHFDVNRSGKIEVLKMPQFMRFLASDQQMQL